MRRALWPVLLVCGACPEARPSFANVCAEANDVVLRCGASVPFITDAPCTGIARFASRCVTEQVHGCDELASLMRNVDRCFPDAGIEAFPEAESLPFPTPSPLDGGTSP